MWQTRAQFHRFCKHKNLPSTEKNCLTKTVYQPKLHSVYTNVINYMYIIFPPYTVSNPKSKFFKANSFQYPFQTYKDPFKSSAVHDINILSPTRGLSQILAWAPSLAWAPRAPYVVEQCIMLAVVVGTYKEARSQSPS